MVGIGTKPDLGPTVERLMEAFVRARPTRLSDRERLVEIVAGSSFLFAAVALALWLPSQRSLSIFAAGVLVAAYAAASRIRLDDGTGYTDGTQLVLVPMLFLLPVAAVPLAVAAGLLLGRLPDYLDGRTHPERALLGLADSWHAVGPALVLGLIGADALDRALWPAYLAALGAQFALDFAVSTVRESLAVGVSPRLQPGLLGWVYLIDASLAPFGLLAAYAVMEDPLAMALVLPFVGLLAVFASERRARVDNALQLSRAYRGATLLLSDALECDDRYTALHSRGVVGLALAVASELQLDERERREVEFGALLHDVGKMVIPNEVINKPGPLTDAERRLMDTHTLEGQRLLERVGGLLEEIGRVVRASHERWDGAGYPDGLAGEAIPLTARIIFCCDAFDAMTTDRPYRLAMSAEVALRELQANAGSQFDPAVVDAIVAVIVSERDRSPDEPRLPVSDPGRQQARPLHTARR
jgi:HD-GYP domain-containing protein (c-di-GMP phosphodiesterase class II)